VDIPQESRLLEQVRDTLRRLHDREDHENDVRLHEPRRQNVRHPGEWIIVEQRTSPPALCAFPGHAAKASFVFGLAILLAGFRVLH
jgi:hypothetical protein